MGKYEYIRKTFTFDGQRYQVYGNTLEEALEKKYELLAALKRGEATSGGNMSVDKWYKEWKALYKDQAGLTPKSLGAYDEKFAYLKPVVKMRLKDVRDIHLQRILNDEAGKSYSHLSKIRNLMQQLFRRARRSRLISFDPSEDLTLPSNKKVSHRELTDGERKYILRVADHHPSGLWVLTILYTGMRPGETAALRWMDVDFTKKEIHVTEALESGTGTRKGPKSSAGVRDIPIHAALLPRLLAARGDPFQPVFPTQGGNFQNSGSIWRLWKSFRRALDIDMGATLYRNQIVKSIVADDLTPYCLRHTFCTDLETAGVPINVAKYLMGHSDISITANIYTHKNQKVLHEGIAKLDGTWGKAEEAKRKPKKNTATV